MKSVDLFCDTGHQLDNLTNSAIHAPSMRWNTWPPLRQSYLGAWFETLKHSAHYTQMSRTGIFPTQAAYETHELFGSVEDQTFEQWWQRQGRKMFGNGEIPLTPDCLLQYQAEQDSFNVAFRFSSKAYTAGGRLSDAMQLARCTCIRVLSYRPVIWPFFRSRVSAAAVFRSLDVLRACNAAGKHGQMKLYEIGERLNLNHAVSTRPGDRGLERTDKHVAMGKLVSTERRRGQALTVNAARGLFPIFTIFD